MCPHIFNKVILLRKNYSKRAKIKKSLEIINNWKICFLCFLLKADVDSINAATFSGFLSFWIAFADYNCFFCVILPLRTIAEREKISFVISLLFGRGLYLFRGVINEMRIRLQKSIRFFQLFSLREINTETFFPLKLILSRERRKKQLDYGMAEIFSVHYFLFFIVSSTTMEPLFPHANFN